MIIFAIPTQGLRYVCIQTTLLTDHLNSKPYPLSHRKLLQDIRPRLDPQNSPLLIFVNKGIEEQTGALTLEIILDTCGKEIATQATFLVRLQAYFERGLSISPNIGIPPGESLSSLDLPLPRRVSSMSSPVLHLDTLLMYTPLIRDEKKKSSGDSLLKYPLYPSQ